MLNITELDSSNFEEEVIKSEIPVLVDFWAPWCMPCKMMEPVVEAVARRYEGRLKVGKVNTDDHPSIAAKYNIFGIPTIILFKDGHEVERIVGFVSEKSLASKVEPLLDKER